MNARTLFGQALRGYRKRLGWPPRMVAEALNFSEQKLYRLERGELRPNEEDAQNADDYFDAKGNLVWLAGISREAEEPYGSLLMYEPMALAIRIWESRMIPGLFQTEAYASALLRNEAAVEERMGRRSKVFDDGEPASVNAVVAETALRAIIGSKEILREQLEFLISDDRWTVQVMPMSAVLYPQAADGPMMLLDLDGTTIAYTQTWGDLSSIMDTPSQIRSAWDTWDAVLGRALPIEESRRMIESVIGEFK